MDGETKRWTAHGKSVLVMEIIGGRTRVARAPMPFHRTPSQVERGAEQARPAWCP